MNYHGQEKSGENGQARQEKEEIREEAFRLAPTGARNFCQLYHRQLLLNLVPFSAPIVNVIAKLSSDDGRHPCSLLSRHERRAHDFCAPCSHVPCIALNRSGPRPSTTATNADSKACFPDHPADIPGRSGHSDMDDFKITATHRRKRTPTQQYDQASRLHGHREV